MLVLASESPSRAALLKDMGVAFRIAPMNIDETPQKGERPADYVKRISGEKARTAASKIPNLPILAADTIVSVGARIMRKAQDEQESAFQMRLLSGRRHRVHTCVTLALPSPTPRMIQRLSTTYVAFKVLTPEEIIAFVASEEWRHVAVYHHEGHARFFIRWMRGLPTTIQGLPFLDTYHLLRGHSLV